MILLGAYDGTFNGIELLHQTFSPQDLLPIHSPEHKKESLLFEIPAGFIINFNLPFQMNIKVLPD